MYSPAPPKMGLDRISRYWEPDLVAVLAWVTLVRAAGTTLRAVAVVCQYRWLVHTPGAAHFGVDPTDVPVPVSGKAVRPVEALVGARRSPQSRLHTMVVHGRTRAVWPAG